MQSVPCIALSPQSYIKFGSMNYMLNWIVQLQRHIVIDVHIHRQDFVTNCEGHSRPPSIAYLQNIGSLGNDCAWRHSRPQRVHTEQQAYS